jgi:hypothetical protein
LIEEEDQMKIQLHKTEMAEILGVIALAAIMLTVVLVALPNVISPVTGSDVAQAPVQPVQPEGSVIGFNKPIAEYSLAERMQYQITESYETAPVYAAALPKTTVISAGPDLAAMDIRMREQYQITEEYPFNPVDFSTMDPHERERFQITEYYP